MPVCDPPAWPALNVVDVVVGGPPASVSPHRSGEARGKSPVTQAFLKDPRAGLHERWVAWVREPKPLAVLVENVPDALTAGGRNIAEEIAVDLDVLVSSVATPSSIPSTTACRRRVSACS